METSGYIRLNGNEGGANFVKVRYSGRCSGFADYRRFRNSDFVILGSPRYEAVAFRKRRSIHAISFCSKYWAGVSLET